MQWRLVAVGRFDLIDTLLDNMRHYGEANSVVGAVTRTVAVPVVEAIAAHRSGQYDRVVNLLWPVRRDLHLIGGSHAQRDIFFQILTDAAVRAGRETETRILLQDIATIGFETGNRALALHRRRCIRCLAAITRIAAFDDSHIHCAADLKDAHDILPT